MVDAAKALGAKVANVAGRQRMLTQRIKEMLLGKLGGCDSQAGPQKYSPDNNGSIRGHKARRDGGEVIAKIIKQQVGLQMSMRNLVVYGQPCGIK